MRVIDVCFVAIWCFNNRTTSKGPNDDGLRSLLPLFEHLKCGKQCWQALYEHFSFNKSIYALLLIHFSHVQLCETPQMAAHQAPLSLGFSR